MPEHVVQPLIRAVKRGIDFNLHKPRKPPAVWASPAMTNLLSKPSWSVRSLLDRSLDAGTEGSSEVTRKKLHHLLRLSALPQPKDGNEEDQLLKTLESQIHFVKEIQKVDTTHVEPLEVIRDETEEGIEEQTVKLQDLQPYLDMEEKVGKNGTVRRRKDVVLPGQKEGMQWNPFELGVGSEQRRTGKYFVVKKKKAVTEGGLKKSGHGDG